MASTLETLVVKLTADATKLEQEFNRQIRNAETAGTKIRAGLRLGVQGFAVLGTAATGAATAMTLLVNRTAAYADEVDKAAIRTRLARSTVQELRFVADQAGGSFQAIEQNVRAFTGRLAELERGSQTVTRTFDRLGVSVYDANGALRDTEALFLDTITALAGVENETERAALAVQAFGETGTELLPILSAGADGIEAMRDKANELGLVLDDQRIGALVQYKDSVSRIGQAFEAAQREISIGFLPVLKDGVLPLLENFLIPRLRDAVTDLFALETAFDNSGEATDELRGKLADIAASVVTFGDILLDLGRISVGLTQVITAPFATLGAVIGSLSVDLGRFLDGMAEITDGLELWQRGSWWGAAAIFRQSRDLFNNTIGAGVAGAVQAGIEQGAAGLANLERGFTGLGDLGPAEAARQAVLNGTTILGGNRNAPGTYNPAGAAGAPSGTPSDPVAVTLSNIRAVNLGREPEDDFPRTRTGANFRAWWAANGPAAPTPSGIASSLNRTLEDAGTVGRGIVLREAAEADRVLGEWFARRIQVTTASFRMDEDAGTMGRAENNALVAQAQAEADAEVTAFLLRRLQVTTASLRQGEDAGTVGRGIVTSEREAEAARAKAERQAQQEIASYEALARIRYSLNLATRQGIEAESALLDLRKRAGFMGGKPGSGFDGSWRDRGSGGVFDGPLVKQGAEDLRIAGEEFRANVVESSILFGTNLVNAFKSGDPSSIFGAVTGGIGSILGLFNPLAGEFFSLVGGLGSALIGLGRNEESEATRALGASTRGAPAIEFNVSVYQSLNIASLTGEGRRAVDGLLNDTASRIEAVITRNVLPRLGYLEERIA